MSRLGDRAIRLCVDAHEANVDLIKAGEQPDDTVGVLRYRYHAALAECRDFGKAYAEAEADEATLPRPEGVTVEAIEAALGEAEIITYGNPLRIAHEVSVFAMDLNDRDHTPLIYGLRGTVALIMSRLATLRYIARRWRVTIPDSHLRIFGDEPPVTRTHAAALLCSFTWELARYCVAHEQDQERMEPRIGVCLLEALIGLAIVISDGEVVSEADAWASLASIITPTASEPTP